MTEISRTIEYEFFPKFTTLEGLHRFIKFVYRDIVLEEFDIEESAIFLESMEYYYHFLSEAVYKSAEIKQLLPLEENRLYDEVHSRLQSNEISEPFENGRFYTLDRIIPDSELFQMFTRDVCNSIHQNRLFYTKMNYHRNRVDSYIKTFYCPKGDVW